MSYYTPAQIGMPLADVDTPALLLDLDAFERNLKLLNDSLAGRSIKVRPHAKSHKCPDIALRQIALRMLPEGERGRGDGGWRRQRCPDCQ